MADFLGPVPIPEPPGPEPPANIPDFPFRGDFGTSQEIPDRIVAHLLDQPGLKTEQRFFVGDGARRFRVRKYQLDCAEYDALKTHWQSAQGVYAEFNYQHPLSHNTFQTFRVRYADPQLTFQHVVDLTCSDPGLTLIEVPQVTPAYVASKTLERFPDSAFADQLLDQAQRIVPLVIIEPRGQSKIYLSDRRLTLDGQLYLPRLIEWSGISQSIGENSDNAQFTMGNADAVWWDYTKQIDLTRATVDFHLFFVTSNVLLKLWRGYTTSLRFRDDENLEISAADGIYELNLPYPTRQVSRTCWKEFKDGVWCPYSGPETFCNKSVEDCKARGMELHFGGQIANIQGFRTKDVSTGTSGYGRSQITSVTVRNDTIYQRVVQEVYTDIPMAVVCDVAGGRDESEYYSAIGIVSEGPIGTLTTDGFSGDLLKHTLDKQSPHDPKNGGGWRGVPGRDPANRGYDFFGVSQAPWNAAPPNSNYAAGTAFAEIRRTDAEGIQISKITDREMVVTVVHGMGGWIWTAPGARVWKYALVNPIWIAVNAYLKALGLRADPQHAGVITAAMQEALFDVEEAMFWANICDTMVPKIVGTGNELQFPFRGAIKEQKPLRDWLQEILNTCLGYYTFVSGKLRLGIRINSSVPTGGAFTKWNVLHRSVQADPVIPKFNYISGEFGDEEFEFQLNRVIVYDIDNAKFYGNPSAPRYTQSQMSLVGVSNKSQASRIVATRMREELGGITRKEQQDARNISLRSTILALGIYPGQICSLDHERLPNNRSEFRVVRWKLNPDWSIEISGSSTCDSMYNLAIGPKPADVPAEPGPPERFPASQGMAWMPNELGPWTGDPMYPPGSLTFALWQDYSLTMEGAWVPTIVVRGERTINRFLDGDAPVIRGIKYATTGGNLPGGQTYYVQVAQRDADANAHVLAPSNVAAIWVPAGTNTNTVTVEPIQTRVSLPGYSVFAGTNIRLLSEQYTTGSLTLPATITIYNVLPMTRNAPNSAARRIRIKCKRVVHSGVAGIQVQQVIAPNKIRTSELTGPAPTGGWVGQVLSVVADASDGSVPLWNFTITAFDQAQGEFTVSPDCVRAAPEDSVQPMDVMIVRSRASATGANFVTNALWKNSVAASQNPEALNGLVPGEEVGLFLRIIGGTGKGQVRAIEANDNLTHWVIPPWTEQPDTTSIYIVEMPEWGPSAECSDAPVDEQNDRVEIAVRVDNLDNSVVLAGGFLVDEKEQETYEPFAVFREIFVFGQPYEVRTVGTSGDEMAVTDQTMRVDTTDGDKTVYLPDLGPYFGRSTLVVNDGVGSGAGKVIIKPVGADEFSTNEDEIILEKPGDWCEFVAAGDKTKTVGRAHGRGYINPESVWARASRWPVQHPRFRQRRGRTRLPMTRRHPDSEGQES